MLWDEPKIFFLERRYFFSIILSEFLKNRVALHLQSVSIVAAFPIGVVIVMITVSFLKDAKNYMAESTQ